MPQSLMRNVTAPLPNPSRSARAVIWRRASSLARPEYSPEFSSTPSSGKDSAIADSSAKAPSAGRITGRTAMPYLRQNSKSRWSCAGTAMMAPVP